MNRLSAAVAHAEHGWPVFPTQPNKRPAPGFPWRELATTDVEVVRDWWVQDPDAGIGIKLGAESGVWVLDSDSYKDPEKAKAWEKYLAENGGLPTTRTVRTGSGGTHYYFKQPEGRLIRNSGAFTAYNVDIRGEGGYVLGAGSESVSGTYVTVSRAPVADPPSWLVSAILSPVERASRPVESVSTESFGEDEWADLDHFSRRIMRMELDRLDECKKAAVPEREWATAYRGEPWDETTFAVACKLIEFANANWNRVTEDEAYDLLLRHAPRDSGFGEREIIAKWNSARKKIGDKARDFPESTGGGVWTPDGNGGKKKVVANPAAFFAPKEGLQAQTLAAEVLKLGPLAIDNTRNAGIWEYRGGVWQEAPRVVQQRCVTLLGERFRPGHVVSVLPVIQQRCLTEGRIITCEAVEDFINVRNGMLHWRSGELVEHHPDFYSTVQLPVEWNPGAQCPQFDSFAASIVPGDALDFLWEIVGYMVYSGNPLQRAILLYGEGSNGKGTLIRVLQALLGHANVSAVTLQDMSEGKFETADLFGKIANLAGDIDPAYLRSTAKFKAITGEDTIEAQRKYEHGFRFKCWAVPVFSANRLWKSVDTTSGYRRRWVVVPFPNTFGIGADLTSRLTTQAELQGVLAHAVRSLRSLMGRGEFLAPESVQRAKGEFDVASDQVREWLDDEDEAVFVVRDPSRSDVWTASSDAYNAYRSWCEQSSHKAVSATEFKARMQRIGYDVKKVGSVRIFGLQIDRRKGQSVPFVLPQQVTSN